MPRKSVKEKRECFVNDKPQYSFKENVHKQVCQDLPVDFEYDGQYYCVLHLPDDQKHKNTDFKSIFQARLEKQDNNFQYTYFPDKVYVMGHEFTSHTNFLGCKFKQDADFIDTTFNERIIFENAVFTQDVSFARTIFLKNIYFTNAIFGAVKTPNLEPLGWRVSSSIHISIISAAFPNHV